MGQVITQMPMTEEVRKAIIAVVCYANDDEWRSFQEWIEMGEDPTHHIWYSIKVIATWLEENPSEDDRCPRCGLIDDGEADYIKDHGHCIGCHVAWQMGELPEQQGWKFSARGPNTGQYETFDGYETEEEADEAIIMMRAAGFYDFEGPIRENEDFEEKDNE